MIAKKGLGKEHSKWSPVSTCVMQYVPEIEFLQDRFIIDKLSLKQKKEFVDSCLFCISVKFRFQTAHYSSSSDPISI